MSSLSFSLNDYQQLMLKLSTLSPYNAVHAVLMQTVEIDQCAMEAAINMLIHQLALGEPFFSSNLKNVSFIPRAEPLKLHNCDVSLEQHLESEINYPFKLSEFPLRFFIVTHQTKKYFSITFNHWIADAYTISRIIETIFARLSEIKLPELTLTFPRIEDCFQPIYQHKSFYYRYLGMMQNFFKLLRIFRNFKAHKEGYQIGCTKSGCLSYVFEEDVLTHLLRICKHQQITFNDLLITLLAQLFGQLTYTEREKMKKKWVRPKRNRILIGVIANLRAHSQVPLSHTMGVFLGFFHLAFHTPEQTSFAELSQRVHTQTQRLKRNHAAVKNYLLFKIQKNRLNRQKTQQAQYRFYSKNIPITVSISNMHLHHCDDVLSHFVQQYIRLSPAAMVCPIVFNFTTFNQSLSLSITFQKACYSSTDADQIKDGLVRAVDKLINNDSMGHHGVEV